MAHYLGNFFLMFFLETLKITYCLCSLGCFLPKGKLIIGQFLNHLKAGVHRNRGAILLGSPSHLFAPYLRVPGSYSWEVVMWTLSPTECLVCYQNSFGTSGFSLMYLFICLCCKNIQKIL